MFFEERCTACGICVKRCPQRIITMKNNIPVVDEGKCNFCGKCTNFCPNNAREYVGKNLTSQEIIKEIIKDEVFTNNLVVELHFQVENQCFMLIL